MRRVGVVAKQLAAGGSPPSSLFLTPGPVAEQDEDQKFQDAAGRMVQRMAGVPDERAQNRPKRTEKLARRDSRPAQSVLRSPPEGPDSGTPGSPRRVVVQEAPREVPVLAECEVLVVGAGPGGLSAALAARRAGADVCLVERYGCFGGVITTVGMETLGWYRYEGTVEGEGIGIEMERLAARMGGTVKFPFNSSECLDADNFKVVADHLVRESGIRPVLHCLAVEAIMDGPRIQGIITESKSGRQAILAKVVIDATGDADVCHLAGAEYTVIPTEEALGVTTVFGVAGVDKERFLEYTEANPATYKDWSRTWQQEGDGSGKEDNLRSPYLDMEFEKARQDGVIPKEGTQNLGGSWSSLTDAGEATNLNIVHLPGYDPTNVEDLTKAEMEGRKQTLHALRALQHTLPGFEKAKLRTFGMTLGTRDSRKIVGRYNLTEEDVRGQGRFEDSVGIFPEFVDGYNILLLPTTGRYFQVPYGCLLPVGVENLLVAGRCVAGDRISHAAMRNMMACTVSGQGAGTAAAVAVRCKKTPCTLDVREIQRELKRQGVRLD